MKEKMKDKIKESREKNVRGPSNEPNELAPNVSKKIPSRTNYSSIFLRKFRILPFFSIIYMIRIRFFGPGELIQRYFSGVQYPVRASTRFDQV